METRGLEQVTDGSESMDLEKSNVRCVTSELSTVCPQCEQASLVARHCKLICERCGYVESCEDNFVPSQATADEVDGSHI